MRLSENWYKKLEQEIEVQEVANQYKEKLENLLYKNNSRNTLHEWLYRAPYGTKQAKKYNEDNYKTEIEPLVTQAIEAIENIKTKEDLEAFEKNFVKDPKLKRFIDFKGGNRASNNTPDENEIKKPFTFYNEHDLNGIKDKIKQKESQKELDDYEAEIGARDEEEKKYSPRVRELLRKFRRGTITKEELEELRYLIKTEQGPKPGEDTGNIQTPQENEQIPEGDSTDSILHTDWYALKNRAILYWAKAARGDKAKMADYGITPEDDTGGEVWTREHGTQMAVIAEGGHVVYPNAATAIKDNYKLSKDIDITKLTSEERRSLIMKATKMGDKIYKSCEGELLKFGKGRTTEETVCGYVWRYATPSEIDKAINSGAYKNRYHVNGDDI